MTKDEDEIFERIAAGEGTKAIADSYGTSKQTFYNFIKKGGPERRAKWEQAKKDSAPLLVEEAREIIDEARQDRDITSAQATLTKEAANHLRWTAGKLDRERFGDGPLVQIGSVNFAEMHLDVLRQRGRVSRPEEPEAIPAEVVEEPEPIPAEIVEEAPVREVPKHMISTYSMGADQDDLDPLADLRDA